MPERNGGGFAPLTRWRGDRHHPLLCPGRLRRPDRHSRLSSLATLAWLGASAAAGAKTSAEARPRPDTPGWKPASQKAVGGYAVPAGRSRFSRLGDGGRPRSTPDEVTTERRHRAAASRQLPVIRRTGRGVRERRHWRVAIANDTGSSKYGVGRWPGRSGGAAAAPGEISTPHDTGRPTSPFSAHQPPPLRRLRAGWKTALPDPAFNRRTGTRRGAPAAELQVSSLRSVSADRAKSR